MQKGFERWPKVYTPEEVLQHVNVVSCSNKDRAVFDGHPVRFQTSRLRVFKRDNCVCASCGLKADRFYKERNRGTNTPYHLNLYAIVNGNERLFTRDHIVPSSKGGSDLIENCQTMCSLCNRRKADSLPNEIVQRRAGMVHVGNLRSGYTNPAGKQFPVDRRTPLGNIFFMVNESQRDAVCEQYETWFYNSVLLGGINAEARPNDSLTKAWKYLQTLLDEARKGDIVLMCWCAPKRCHAETIAKWLNQELARG